MSRGFTRVCRASTLAVAVTVMVLADTGGAAYASTTDIVLYAADATAVQGNWAATASESAATGRAMVSADLGWSSTDSPLASPSNYFELTFDAPAATSYRIWLRLRAGHNSKWNDSVWIQFSDAADSNGVAAYRIASTDGLMVNLERCGGCGISAWGWQNTAYWLTQSTDVQFASAGPHTIRVQSREDGVEIDQIVLSPVTYFRTPPGSLTNDTTILSASAAIDEVVLYAADARRMTGHWSDVARNGAAAGRSMSSADHGWSALDAPLATPTDYFELTFDAPAAKTFRVWLRLRAGANSKWNDAVWVQFSDATLPAGGAVYGIGTRSALMVNLERCAGCGTSGWGWQNTAYWLTQPTEIRFATSGPHTIRVQTREDGVEVDQIVLSASRYRGTAPGPIVDDATILAATQRPEASEEAPSTPQESPRPYRGTALVLPGTVEAADFDDGGDGVAYSDSTAGNEGKTYRSTDVDIQTASGGGYNVGWTTPGEWLKYSVHVAAAGDYLVQLRVAAPSPRTIDVGLGPVSTTVSVPDTGHWQAWTTVAVPMTLDAGPQTMTVGFPVGGVNLRSITVTAAPTSPPTSGTPTGGSVRVMTWNIQQGYTRAGAYDPLAQATFIASQLPDVVLLQEINTSRENQPARYKALLEQLTGQSWFVQWAPIMDSRPTEGNVVLTRLPVTSSASHQMHATADWTAMYANRSVAQATVLVGGVPVHMFSTHLDYYNTTHRTAQLLDMMAWAEAFGSRRIVGGDFNSWWGEYWIVTMMADYDDTWQDVMKTNQKGYTVNDAVRFDYLFRAKEGGGQVVPTAVWVPATTLSDHYPVIADYGVTP